MGVHWRDNDYFVYLLRGLEQACSALEYMVDDLHLDKERTVEAFLNHAGSEDFLWGLVNFLGNTNPRVAGNAAYILGTLAESESGRRRVISLTESRHEERKRILADLVYLLSSSDSESVMNAAGTIGTLAESDEGRDWLLQESCTQLMVEKVTSLLTNANAWTASNAALVLARLTISERGCELLLENQFNKIILSQLVGSLGTDEAGRGMNAAFAIGRLCDTSKGRTMLLTLPEATKMITHLANMLCSDDSGSSKNACFAISCLAASSEGHEKLIENTMCDRVMNTLSQLLTAEDYETGWFAAMTLRTFSSRPKGCIRLRELSRIVPALQEAMVISPDNEDMIREVEETLCILKLLDRPDPPVATVLGPREVHITWSKVETRSGLPVSYRLLDGTDCVYSGTSLETTLSDLSPSETLSLKLRACVPGDDSPFSEVVTVVTDEDNPQEPTNLALLAFTATQLKIGWEPPGNACGPIKAYHVFMGGHIENTRLPECYIRESADSRCMLDGSQIEHTTELSCIISGLKEQTTYSVQVCASTSKGKGPKASLDCVTANLGDHCPSKPSLSCMGRTEINVTWDPPQVPLGRITRYDVSMNGRVIYSGKELHCTAHHLTPHTEYTFVVTVITNEGPQKSKPASKRTAKDEFDLQRMPLYVPPIKREETKQDMDSSSLSGKRRKKRPSVGKIVTREKSLSASKQKSSLKKIAQASGTSTPDKPSSAGSDSPSTDIKDSPLLSSHLPDTKSSPIQAPVRPIPAHSRIRSDMSNGRGDNTQSPINNHRAINSIIDNPRSNSFSSSTSKSATLHSNSSSHKSQHRGSISGLEQEKLTRTLTSLNIATFEPMLPPSFHQQRSTTFIGQKRTGGLRAAQNQYTTVVHGNATPFNMEIPSKYTMGLAQSPASRFTPVQYRTQPSHLPQHSTTSAALKAGSATTARTQLSNHSFH